MKIEPFEMERMQSTWENLVDYDMSESGIRAVTLRELIEMGFDLDNCMDLPLGYSQSNGTIELRKLIARHYPGADIDNIEVTNGTSEANYMLCLVLLKTGDEMALEIPNYMQLWGVPLSLGAELNFFKLNFEQNWEPDWEDFEKAVKTGDKVAIKQKMLDIQSDKFALKEINKWPKDIRSQYNREIGKLYASVDKRVKKKIIQDLKKQGLKVSTKDIKMTNATNSSNRVKVGSDRDISVEYSFVDKNGKTVTLEYPLSLIHI